MSYLMMILSLGIAISLFGTCFLLKDNISALIGENLNDINRGDVSIIYKANGGLFNDDQKDFIETLKRDNIAYYTEQFVEGSIYFKNQTYKTVIRFIDFSDSEYFINSKRNEGIYISENLGHQLNVNEGDHVSLQLLNHLPIVSVAVDDIVANNEINLSKTNVIGYVFIDKEMMKEMIPKAYFNELNFGYEDILSKGLYIDDSAFVKNNLKEVYELFDVEVTYPDNKTRITTPEMIIEDYQLIVDQISKTMILLAGFSFFIVGPGYITLQYHRLVKSRKEFVILKSLGLRKKDLHMMIGLEVLLVSLLASVLGMIASTMLYSYIIVHIVGLEVTSMLTWYHGFVLLKVGLTSVIITAMLSVSVTSYLLKIQPVEILRNAIQNDSKIELIKWFGINMLLIMFFFSVLFRDRSTVISMFLISALLVILFGIVSLILLGVSKLKFSRKITSLMRSNIKSDFTLVASMFTIIGILLVFTQVVITITFGLSTSITDHFRKYENFEIAAILDYESVEDFEKAVYQYDSNAFKSGNTNVRIDGHEINVNIVSDLRKAKDKTAVVTNDFLVQNNYKIGDTLTVETDQLCHGYEIIGINNRSNLSPLYSEVILYDPLDQFSLYTVNYYFQNKDIMSSIQKFNEEGTHGVLMFSGETLAKQLLMALNKYVSIINIVLIIFFISSILLICNFIGIIMEKRKKEYIIMKTFGVKNKHLLFALISEMVVMTSLVCVITMTISNYLLKVVSMSIGSFKVSFSWLSILLVTASIVLGYAVVILFYFKKLNLDRDSYYLRKSE